MNKRPSIVFPYLKPHALVSNSEVQRRTKVRNAANRAYFHLIQHEYKQDPEVWAYAAWELGMIDTLERDEVTGDFDC